jgi:hypothetical protein
VVLCAAAGLVFAQPLPSPDQGRWIIRPAAVNHFIDAGMDPVSASARRLAAEERLTPFAVSSIPTIDATVVTPRHPSLVRDWLDTGDYLWAEPDPVVLPLAEPNDPLFRQQWHLARIGAPSAWDRTVGSASVVVALVDTGVDLTHPDLAPSLVSGYNSESRLAQAAGGEVADLNGHGTAVAGIVGAVGNNARGVAGLNWSVGLLPVRASNMPSGSAFFSDVLDGVGWAGTNGADVVSVSYEGVNNRAVQDMGWYLRTRDVLLVWGAGNNAARLDNDWTDVIIVGGTDSADRRWSSSAFGPAIDLVAPAVDVLTTARGGGYAPRTGTSFAAPVVAGLAALLRAAEPDLTADEIEDRLRSSAVDLGPPGRDPDFGFGRVDAAAALRSAPAPGARAVEPDVPAGARFLFPGVMAQYFRTGPLTRLPDLSARTPDVVVIEPGLSFAPTTGAFGRGGMIDGFAARFRAVVRIPTPGQHALWLTSDDGSRLSLAGVRIIDNDGVHGPIERSALVRLDAGSYSLEIDYFNASGSAMLRLDVQGPGTPRRPVPAEWLRFRASPADCNGDGTIDFADLLIFLDWFNRRDMRADLNEDGAVDENDWLLFLDLYNLATR